MVCYKQNAGLKLSPRSRTQVGLPSSPLALDHTSFLDLLYIVLVVTISDPMDMEYFQSACTGTLISKKLVLTVATCIHMDDFQDPNPSSTTVYKRPNVSFSTIRIFIYPGYSKMKSFNVAIIQVDGSHPVLSTFPSIPDKMERFTDDRLKACVLAGYGKQSKPNVKNFQVISLNETKAQLISCRGPEPAERVCLHFEDIMPCSGDMGSALVCGDRLVAIYTPTSDPGKHSESCMNLFGCVFTPVNSISPWVSRLLEAPHAHLAWLNNPWYISVLSVAVLGATAGMYYALVELMQHKYPPKFDTTSPRVSPQPSGSFQPDPSPTSSTYAAHVTTS